MLSMLPVTGAHCMNMKATLQIVYWPEHWQTASHCKRTQVEGNGKMTYLQTMPLSFILVLTIQHLHFCVLDKRVIHVLAALDVQLQVHVALLPGALVLHIDALHKVEGMAFKQVVDGPLDFGVLQADTHTHAACMSPFTPQTGPGACLLSLMQCVN